MEIKQDDIQEPKQPETVSINPKSTVNIFIDYFKRSSECCFVRSVLLHNITEITLGEKKNPFHSSNFNNRRACPLGFFPNEFS